MSNRFSEDDDRVYANDDEMYDDYDYDYREDYDDNDYERDTFDALTDGQYGDYDEWRENGGDIGSLMDALGY